MLSDLRWRVDLSAFDPSRRGDPIDFTPVGLLSDLALLVLASLVLMAVKLARTMFCEFLWLPSEDADSSTTGKTALGEVFPVFWSDGLLPSWVSRETFVDIKSILLSPWPSTSCEMAAFLSKLSQDGLCVAGDFFCFLRVALWAVSVWFSLKGLFSSAEGCSFLMTAGCSSVPTRSGVAVNALQCIC